MTKSVLIEKIAEKLDGLSKKQTEVIVETIFESVKEALAKGGKVEIRGFGNFRLRSRNARKARNPKTGEPAKALKFLRRKFLTSRSAKSSGRWLTGTTKDCCYF
jgi:integration host factor subunit beta